MHDLKINETRLQVDMPYKFKVKHSSRVDLRPLRLLENFPAHGWFHSVTCQLNPPPLPGCPWRH